MIGIELDPLGRLLRFEAVPSLPPAGRPRRQRRLGDLSLPPPGSIASAFAPADPRSFLPSTRTPGWPGWKRNPRAPTARCASKLPRSAGAPCTSSSPGPGAAHPAAGGPAGVGTLAAPIAFLDAARRRRAARAPEPAPRTRRPPGSHASGPLQLRCVHARLGARIAATRRISRSSLFIQGLGRALFVASLSWLIYIALEPLIRRRWPDSLIAWTRLLSGRFTIRSSAARCWRERCSACSRPSPAKSWSSRSARSLRHRRHSILSLGPDAAGPARRRRSSRRGVGRDHVRGDRVGLDLFSAQGRPSQGMAGCRRVRALSRWILSARRVDRIRASVSSFRPRFIFVFLRFGLLALVFANYFTTSSSSR